MKHVLIVQGGGFRTAFSTGVLDGFQAASYDPFDTYIGISGGAIALSYFLSSQYLTCAKAMQFLAEDPEFVQLKRLVRPEGYMNIDQLRTVAEYHMPFHVRTAVNATKTKNIHFVCTDRNDGSPHYLQPGLEDWIEVVIASCTLPFVTKGLHEVRGLHLFDGGWGDALPVEWAVNQGAERILVVRTLPKNRKFPQSWPDYFGSIYFRSNPALSKCFAHAHEKYNASIDFINNISPSVHIDQISPEEGLKCSTYNYSVPFIWSDYRYGFQLGINHARQLDF